MLRSPPLQRSLRSPHRLLLLALLAASLADHSSHIAREAAYSWAARLARFVRRLACRLLQSTCSLRSPALTHFVRLLASPAARSPGSSLRSPGAWQLASLARQLASLSLTVRFARSLAARLLAARLAAHLRAASAAASVSIALPARGGKLRCKSPQSLSDPPFCTTLPFPIFDPSGLMARARNPDRIARAPAPGIKVY